ncbi:MULTISPECIES: CDGSH iron-sulfur domain-containing protein [Streptomyces]|uniref:CDGSH iron-sulfur domain-containing protein n=1 Tax=Streptomyces TaxID=1883 RepID=UPI002E18C886|nr:MULTISPECIES: CDGSH iron-sulfur domain-containing protein [unclassified Streptomyces]
MPDVQDPAPHSASARGVRVSENGPYLVTGGVPLIQLVIVTDARGQSVEWWQQRTYDTEETYELCRCGQSANKPFCDRSHERAGFDGTETASRLPYLEQADEQDGPELTLTDAQPLCAFARFCDADGQVWNLVEEKGTADVVERETGDCPSGRLVAWNLAERRPVEPELPPSIGIIEDPQEGVSGGIWVRGGIPVTAADGTPYEVRNRVTLCRCGASRNKPFCDGTHASIGFKDT